MSTNRDGLRTGKLPQELLERLLARVEDRDPRVLVGPGIGRDAAVLDYGDRVLVAKADPITFAGEHIGWYAVHINANDVACTGARPLWFLATILLPNSADEQLASAIFDQVQGACAELGVALIGGHTEVAPDLTRPIVAGAMLGEAARDAVVATSGARPGDAIILTKGIALEGTAVLAREAGAHLEAAGVPRDVVGRARELLFNPGISVVREARAAAEGTVHAMHDPTEGGLGTALRELATAAGVGIEVDREAIPILPETAAVCAALKLDPLGLLASGSLLLTVPEGEASALRHRLEGAGVYSTQIGRVTPVDSGLIMRTRHGLEPLPLFLRDELARWFDEVHVGE